MSKNSKSNKNKNIQKVNYTYPDVIKDSFLNLIFYALLQFFFTFIVMLFAVFKQVWITVNNIQESISREELTKLILAKYSEFDMSAMLIVALLLSSASTIAFFLLKMKKRGDLGDFKKLPLTEITKFLCYGVLFNLFISILLNLVLSNVDNSANKELNDMIAGMMNGNPIVLFLTIGVLAPLTEELVFRYGIYKSFAKINPKVGIIISGIVFGLIHMNLVQSTYAMLLGFLFAFIYYKSENIFYPILLHIGINGSSTITALFFEDEYIGLSFCVGVSLLTMICMIFVKVIKTKIGESAKVNIS